MLNSIAVKNELFREGMADKPLLRSPIAAVRRSESAGRRTVNRFSLRMALRCRPIEPRQTACFPQPLDPIIPGESLKISSKDLLFTSSHVFLAGQVVEVSIDWPALLENGVRLTLVVEGPITRLLRGVTAMRFNRYQFRTRGRSGVSRLTHGQGDHALMFVMAKD